MIVKLLDDLLGWVGLGNTAEDVKLHHNQMGCG